MDALDLVAKIKMDLSEYEEGLDKAKSKAQSSGQGITGAFGKIASVGGKAIAGLTKATAVAVGAAATGIGTLVTQSVQAYGEYEQMVGGVQKLYGNMGMSLEEYANTVGKATSEVKEEWTNLETAQNLVLENAQNAYKTAGMSANQYMETATSFSAALIQSYEGDTIKAAEATDVAMTAISDNWNTFGGDIQNIQNAYQGFAKQNYTMLDNLKLGYGGTKTEMERLIEDANEYAATIGEASDLSIDSFADIVTAIDLIQQKQNIAGTTAREASTTISGSLGMLKAAWTNLVTGIADENADIDQLMQNVVDSLVGYTDEAGNHINGFLDNIIPVIENALTSVGTLIQKLMPAALDMIPTLINDVLPKLTDAATQLAEGLVSSLSDNMNTISDVISQLVESIVNLLPDIISLGGQIVSTLATAIMDNLDNILETAGEILDMIVQGITEHDDELVDGALTIVEKLGEFIAENIDSILDVAVSLIEAISTGIAEHADELLVVALEIITALVEGLGQALPTLIAFLPTLIETVVATLTSEENLNNVMQAWETLMNALIDALPAITDAIAEAIPQIIAVIEEYMNGDGLMKVQQAAATMFNGLLEALGIVAVLILASIGNMIVSVVGEIVMAAGDALSAGKTFFEGVKNGIVQVASNILSSIKTTISGWISAVTSTVSEWTQAGADLISGLWNGFKGQIGSVTESISSWATSIVSAVKSKFGIASPSKVFAEIGGYLAEGLGEGWEKEIGAVNDQINDDMKYNADLDVSSSISDIPTTTITQKSLFSDEDLDKIIDGLSFQFTNITNIDGKAIKKETYDYFIDRATNEQRSVAVATGGYY